jgi:hypothetical protein
LNVPASMFCPHNRIYLECPLCQWAAPAPAPIADAPEVVEAELELPPWCDALSLDTQRRVLTLRASARVRLPGLGDRVATFDYEMTLAHADALIAELTKLRDRARQASAVIDVPSSPSPSRGRSS